MSDLIRAFGPTAKRWAAGATVDEPVIAADETAFLEALSEAARRRLRGETFATAMFMEEDATRFARLWAAQALAAAPGFDERLNLCAILAGGQLRVDGKSALEAGAVPADALALGRSLFAMSQSAVAVSETAYARLAGAFGRWHPRRIFARERDPQVPAAAHFARGEGEHLVVWAAGTPLDELGVILCAVEHLHVPVYVVCDGGEIPAGLHRCTPEQGAALLSNAMAAVDVRTDAPGTALALAELGIPVAAARACGAHELLDGMASFEPWHRDSVMSAVLHAMGAAPPQPRGVARATLPPAPVQVRERGPLVSYVLPTYNRRGLLPFALESVARQRYPNIEKIVVNDAGEAVGDIAARFGATVVDRERNGGHAAALNSGFSQSKGKYVAFLDDDDLLFPDHVETLVEVLERRDGAFAHSNSLMMLRGPDDRITGFSPGVSTAIDPDQTLVVSPSLGFLTFLLRRDALEALGLFEERLEPNDDYEMIVRLTQTFDPIHVDKTTCLYRYTGSAANMSVAAGLRYVDLYEEAYKMAPFPDRPLLAGRRRQFVEALRGLGGVRLYTVNARLTVPVELGEFTGW